MTIKTNRVKNYGPAATAAVLAIAALVYSAAAVAQSPVRADGSSVFADVAERVLPGVVLIKTEKTVDPSEERRSPFNFFFRDGMPDDDHPRRNRGGGSGFFFDKEGRIFTNYHVVRDADEIRVVLEQGDEEREFEAEVVGVDPLSDIAIIKIDPPRDMRIVPLGDSDAMRVGDWVMAIGTPFGELQGSATVGIVSAKGRNDLNIMGGRETIFQNYIQTDASINFGNSGGPLLNTRGEAIGINTAINASGQGIGFAIPINHAKRIMDDLIERGKVSYGYMGITLQQLDKDLAAGRGMKIDHGILVQSVQDKSPAEDAGLRSGDVIVSFNEVDVRDDANFRLLVGQTPIGKTVPMRVVRDGKEKKMSIRIGERPSPEVIASMSQEPSRATWLGIEAGDASSPEIRRRYRLGRGQEGVVVLSVEPDSPADEAGIDVGDIITEVYSHEVRNIEDYTAIAEDLKNRKDPIAFLVKNGRSTRFVTVYPNGR